MAEEKKGITVKIDAALHAEIRQFIEQNGMTMADFVSQALYNELHPKIQPQEDMFQRLKDYLRRHNITQKEFVLGLVEAEIRRDEELINAQNAAKLDETAENISDEKAEIIGEGLEDIEEPDEDETEDEDFDEDMDDIEEPDEDEELDDEESEDEDEELDNEESEDESEELDNEESEGEEEDLSEEHGEDFSMAM